MFTNAFWSLDLGQQNFLLPPNRSALFELLLLLLVYLAHSCSAFALKYTNLIVLTTMFYAESKRGRLARGLTKKKQNAAARKVAKPKPLLDTLANYNIWAKEQEATEAAEASSAASHAA